MKEELVRKTNMAKLKVEAKAPTILSFASIGMFIGGAILTGIMTWKFKDKAVEAKEVLEEIKSDEENGNIDAQTAKNCKKRIITSTTIEALKHFAAPAALMVGGTVAGIKSDKIHTNRTAAATSVANAAISTLDRYRQRVREELGEKKDHEYLYGIKEEKIETIEEKGGKSKKKEETISVVNDDDVTSNPFAKFFDASSRYWEKNAEYNMLFLTSKEQELNRQLKRRGYLFFNEVLEALDLPITKEGQYMGWLYEKDNRLGGPNEFSFNIINWANRKFVNGYEPVILLNMKPDGYIFDKIFDK